MDLNEVAPMVIYVANQGGCRPCDAPATSSAMEVQEDLLLPEWPQLLALHIDLHGGVVSRLEQCMPRP